MGPVKDFRVTCERLNDQGTFSPGDTVSGTVAFSLTKDTKVKCLVVKAKGDANVSWTEGSGEDETTYSAHRRYFKLKEHLIGENAKGTVLRQGVHSIKFRFTIPQRDMPSSFTGEHGRIAYVLEAKLSRSWRWPSEAQKQLNFVSKSLPPPLKCPQSGSVSKSMGLFSKGQVRMSATVNRKTCSPGDTLSIVATVCNTSSKTVRPKFNLQQITVFCSGSSTNYSQKNLCKLVGDSIAPNSDVNVSCQMTIPAYATYTLDNCELITVSYSLKVYLDISFAFDPEVVFPLVIVPPSLAAFQPDEAVGPHPAGAVGGPSYSDFPPPALPVSPAINNLGPQPTAPPGFSSTAFTSPSAPSAPPGFPQEEEPPSYMSLFSSSQEPYSSSKSAPKS